MNKEKIQWVNVMATFIEALLEKFKMSDEFKLIPAGAEFYDDSCNYVKLRSQLKDLAAAFRTLSNVSELIAETSEDEDNE